MNEEKARKELQLIFQKELKYGKNNIQWKQLNRAVILLKKFPALANEQFLSSRRCRNKPRYPLFLLAENRSQKRHIETGTSSEKQTNQPTKYIIKSVAKYSVVPQPLVAAMNYLLPNQFFPIPQCTISLRQFYHDLFNKGMKVVSLLQKAFTFFQISIWRC